MWASEEARVKAVRSALRDIASTVCERCVLRMAGIKNSKFHQTSYIERADANGKDSEDTAPPSPKRPRSESPSPCRVCLGVLQDDIMLGQMDRVSVDVRDCGYDADHFTVALSLPVSMALRQHAINVYVAERLAGTDDADQFDEDDVVPIKQVWKWLFPRRMEEAMGKKCVAGEGCQFYLELQVNFDKDEEELQCLRTMCEAEYAMREKKHNVYHMGLVTRQGLEKSLASVSAKQFKANYPVPPDLPERPFVASVSMNHNNIFIAGRYNKYSRHLPQTPWLVDGERKAESSVEELILGEIRKYFTFDQARFSSSGREDVDVRMLGRGRPFMFEVTNPRKTVFTVEEMAGLTERVNASTGERVKIRDLQVVDKSTVKHLKEGEDQKTKTYNALCFYPATGPLDFEAIKSKLESVKDLELSQKTPIRVLHRRSNAVRKRSVYYMSVSRDGLPEAAPAGDKLLFKLKLATQAGTYVKEFVHGDFMRTTPNLRTILDSEGVDIAALDVEEIDLDWPPRLLESSVEKEAE